MPICNDNALLLDLSCALIVLVKSSNFSLIDFLTFPSTPLTLMLKPETCCSVPLFSATTVIAEPPSAVYTDVPVASTPIALVALPAANVAKP